MKNDDAKSKKLFVRIVGVAAFIAVVFLGVTQMRPATFLGGIAEKSQASLASLSVVPNNSTQAKGQAFYIDVVLHAGSETPKDVKVVLNYDNERIKAMYVETVPATFLGISQHYVLQPSSITISGTLPEGAVAPNSDIVIGKIYFRALQNIGEAALNFDTTQTTISSYESSTNIVGETSNGRVSITVL